MDFESKQAEVLARGAAKRGEYSPVPGSAPLRLYNYWLREGISEPPIRENFCHYWRVVVLWAPLTWFALNVIAPIFTNRVSRAFGRGVVKVSGGFGRFVARQVHRVSQNAWETFFEWVAKVLIGLMAVAGLVLVLFMASTNWLVALGIFLAAFFVVGLITVVVWFVGNELEKRQMAREAARAALLEKWYNGELDEYPRYGKTKKAPGPFKRFFKGVGEFLVLAVQVVRVNKWKICPIVEIPEA